MIKCNKCGQEKSQDDFSKGRKVCKSCRKEYNKEYYNSHQQKFKTNNKNYYLSKKEKLKSAALAYYYDNQEEIIQKRRDYRKNNLETVLETNRRYCLKHREKVTRANRAYRFRNKERIDKLERIYILNNKEKIIKAKRLYRLKNKEKIRRKMNNYFNNRMKTDTVFRIRKLVSHSIRNFLKTNGGHKDGSCLKYLNYTIQELKIHLESLFDPWMNWNNWGTYKLETWDDNDSQTWTWQIDHIIPHSSFKYTSMEDEEFKKCWALSNLRPLNSKANNLKGSKHLDKIKKTNYISG